MRGPDNSPIRAWAIILVVLAMLLVVYPFSMGPMYWLCSDYKNELVGLKGSSFIIGYYPLIWIYQEGPEPLRGTLRWYLGIWEK